MMMRSMPSQTPHVSYRRLAPTKIYCSSRSNSYIPKLEAFSRSKIDRIVKDPPLIEKTENDLADYCSTLEGDSSYSCWRAYFELKELQKEAPKEEVEKVILESGGIKSLIGCLHGISEIHKTKKQMQQRNGSKSSSNSDSDNITSRARRECPLPDGIPKSWEEMEEEENWKMPDSSFTQLLRSKGKFPAWYSPSPDHETD
ncbi:CCG-binding protein 1 [Cynara cardunculus var. scolymus]|uniref:CCG-binding protein 1 n=1 Tax=Cynara cardunculus var. scolymus TaxID=59895 RepID=UPI000D62629D|nr:CCG-binding protein 1 [Cynara cardunculus var. scolymus]